MTVLDTADGVFMNGAYGWAFARPVRKVFYNLVITTVSVVVALLIGLAEMIGVIATGTGVTGGPLGWVAGWDMNYVGFAIVAVFVALWGIALAIWKGGRVEERWNQHLATSSTTSQ